MTSTVVTRFLRDDRGAVSVDWVVLTAVLVGTALATIGAVERGSVGVASGLSDRVGDGDFVLEWTNFGRNPSEMAAELAYGFHDGDWGAARVAGLIDTGTSDEDLQAEYAVWSARASDPGYGNPAEARDQLAVLDIAMTARRVTP